eukprot:PLAT5775.2.p1 GENE.PLAT5775.2~~PLAT5775.2.p1  ORF type:complete len:247 (-),score=46.11 PLAT5775.2:183-893(-)
MEETKSSAPAPAAKAGKDAESIAVPIVIGSVSFWLGADADEEHSHRWTVFVRGPKGEDLSFALRSVTFQLHSSFMDPVRVVEKAPFEVTETGWGEFEVLVRLHFHECGDDALEVRHLLRLYPPGPRKLATKRPVVSETYDEVVFRAPSPALRERLLRGPERTVPRAPHLTNFSEGSDLERLLAARAFVAREIASCRDRLLRSEVEAKRLRDESWSNSGEPEMKRAKVEAVEQPPAL